MNATVHSQAAVQVPFHRKATVVLAVLATVGMIAEAGAPLTGMSATGNVSAPRALHAVLPVLDEPIAISASSVDWSKVPVSADPGPAAVAAYGR